MVGKGLAFVAAPFVAFGAIGTAKADQITHGGTSVTMDFANVGDPGNANDIHDAGYGAVDYAYRIGTYEVSSNQWNAVVGADTNDLLFDPGSWSGNRPVGAITWHEAAMFTNWMTSGDVTQGVYAVNASGQVTGIDRASAHSTYGTAYHLPTENEWYKAAYYDATADTYYDYATGSDAAPTPVASGTGAGTAVYNQSGSQGPADVSQAGGLSPYGTMGQGGNVWEWTETLTGSDTCVVRAGHWINPSVALQADTRGGSFLVLGAGNHTGFRVASTAAAAVPEPSSLAALVGMCCVGLGVALRKRRRKAA